MEYTKLMNDKIINILNSFTTHEIPSNDGKNFAWIKKHLTADEVDAIILEFLSVQYQQTTRIAQMEGQLSALLSASEELQTIVADDKNKIAQMEADKAVLNQTIKNEADREDSVSHLFSLLSRDVEDIIIKLTEKGYDSDPEISVVLASMGDILKGNVD